MKYPQHTHPSQASHHSHHRSDAHPARVPRADHLGTPANRLHDAVARKAYAIYENEGRPEGHALQHWLTAEAGMPA